MSLPIAHALVGASLGVALWPERTPPRHGRAAAVGAMLGICPDTDYLLSRLHVLGWGWHHGFTHSVAFALLVGAAANWGLGLRGWRGVLACVLPVLSHSLLDYVITESPGVALWWPLTAQRYKLGVAELSYYHLVTPLHGRRAFATLGALELLLFAPLLTLSWLARRAQPCRSDR